jgi:hypothetical protein
MKKRYRVTSSAIISAGAKKVYAIIADYREGHPHIIPRKYFTSLEVERGGVGEGTVIRVGMRALGKSHEFRAVITEPEPGRVLVESVLDEGGTVTTFTVEPEGEQSRVTISTELSAAAGLRGWAERRMAGALLRRVYARELELLESFAREGSRAGGAAVAAA